MLAAAYLPKEVVNTTQKMVLMKICDSADDQSLQGRPGLERMMVWANVREKRVATVVTELVRLGLVERVEASRTNRRAEYKVFPCGIPPIPSTEELAERQRVDQEAPRNPNLARKAMERRRPSAAARTAKDIATQGGGGSGKGKEEAGGLRQGNPEEPDPGLPQGDPVHPDWVALGGPTGLPQGNPFSSYGSTYPPPHGSDAAQDADVGRMRGAQGCPAHEQPAANCRGCGTNPRTVRERERWQAGESARQSQQEWLREFLAEQERRVAESDPEAVARARDHALSLARKGRQLPQKIPES